MTGSAQPPTRARLVRIGLLALVILAAFVLVGIGLGLLSPRGSGGSSAEPSTASSMSQGPTSEATASASTSLPSQSPLPTPRANPETGTDLTWERVATFANAPNVLVHDVAAGPGGYVAVGVFTDGEVTELGYEGDPRPAIWRSADGLAWQEEDAGTFGTRTPFKIASDGTHYIVLAHDGDRTRLYRSDDGLAWEPIAGQPILEDARAWDVAAEADGGFIALAAYIDDGHLSFWGSPDGSVWAQSLEVLDGAEPIRLAIGPSEALTFGYGASQLDQSIAPASWVSADGADWQRHDPPTVGHGGLEVAAPIPAGWFAAGYVDRKGIVVWYSPDGRTWTALGDQPELRTDYEGDTGSVGVAFAFAGSEYMFGYAGCCGNPPQQTYVSADSRLWGRVARDVAIAQVHFGTALPEADRVVAIGNTLGDGGLGGTAGIWIGQVQ